MERIKKNDSVVVISGSEKGKTGTIIEISTKKDAVKVKQIKMVTKHQKPRSMGQVGGIKKVESWINISKIMPLCSSCKKATRMRTEILDSGMHMHARACGKCKAIF